MLQAFKDQVETEVQIVYGRHSLIDQHGEKDQAALTDRVFAIVSKAIVNTPAERPKVAITRTDLMSRIFPDVPGDAEWIEQDDPELAEAIYKQLDTDVWRLLNVKDDGPVQQRLNGETGMLLCQTSKTRTRLQGAYVTRNLKCVLEDYSAPAQKKVKAAADAHAALMAQAIERIPEHSASAPFATSSSLARDVRHEQRT